jgi:hypothetical protein
VRRSNWKPSLGVATIDRKHPLSQGLLGWWLFNEGAGNTVYDLSGHGNTGTLVNSPVWRPGRYGMAVDFTQSSDQYIMVPYNTALDLSSSLTISAWVRTRSGGSGNYGVINQTIGGSTNNHYQMQIEGNKLVFRADGTTGARVDGTQTLANDTWYLVAGTWDGSVATSYLLGTTQTEILTNTSYSGPLNTGSGPFLIGTLGTGVYRMNGQMDDVRVYGRCLSANEVLQLYSQPLANLTRRQQVVFRQTATINTSRYFLLFN